MLRALAGLLLALLGSGTFGARTAHACTWQTPTVYVVDPGLRAGDSSAPTPFTGVEARVTRTPGEICRGGTCTSSTCGPLGSVAITFAMPTDDQTEPDALGYRIVWLRGAVPRGASQVLDRVWPLSTPVVGGQGNLGFTIAYDDVEALDAEIALVAVDHAGNESEPSRPVALEFSGCTHSFVDGGCLSDSGCQAARPGASRPGASEAARAAWSGAAALAGLALLGLRARRGRFARRGLGR